MSESKTFLFGGGDSNLSAMLPALLYKGIITDIICSLRFCLEFSGALRFGLVRRCALV